MAASCTLPADFNSIRASESMPICRSDERLWRRRVSRNCAQVRIGDQGSSDRRTCGSRSREPPGRNHILMSGNSARRPARDKLQSLILVPALSMHPSTVATMAHAFTGPLWPFRRPVLLGRTPVPGSILNITSADPWVCSNPPNAPSRPGTTPECRSMRGNFLLG